MRLLLDTQIALWATLKTAKLPKRAIELIGDPANEIFVSAASVWEIAIKFARRRGRPNDMPLSGEAALRLFGEAGYILLTITGAHAAAVDALPPLHADPFDRILVAQAITEPLRLITRDSQLPDYGDVVMLV